ncbi:hypothetical protein [Synechocystis sp. PCC 7338]|uniref:hypothetical protein n=1 Tax=Synechocystis sp. PCC 7338 TaxID=2732530 RepID=UPI001BB0A278|nr:hypothetical protein [Synechocystis sp. PCC 7338]QUS59380.1 hypothetical protein HTZ78_00890 [Synechocystis sp. PCC 7338]
MMDLRECLLFADDVVFQKTGRHLDDIEFGVIEGVLQRKKYADIARDLNCTEGYIKDIGYELWKLFSEIFGEEINKSNIRSSLLRHKFTNNVSISGNDNTVGSIDQVSFYLGLDGKPDKNCQNDEFLTRLIEKLLTVGLTHEQIAECLNINLEKLGIRNEPKNI